MNPVKPLATMQDGWIKIFGLFNYISVFWALILLAGRINLFRATKVAKTVAFVAASGLILFYLGLNIYKIYAFKTYGIKKMHHASSHIIKNVRNDKPDDASKQAFYTNLTLLL